MRLGERLEVGPVRLNIDLLFNPAASFGGVKQSGPGRESGRGGVAELLEYQ
ncbi:aldehyde dehydrogenase family protein [Streptomyces sp. NPDC002776]